MPELPEVETVARGLAAALKGRRIREVRCRLPRILNAEADCFRDALRGKTVSRVMRHGKYVFLLFREGAGVAFHLRMTGQALLLPESEPVDRHTHLEILFHGGGRKLVYRDVRTFGRFDLLDAKPQEFIERKGLGPDALSISAPQLYSRLRGTRRCLKAALLDQRVLAGLGNIYTDEVLFRLRLSPARACSSLNRKTVEALAAGIREILARAIKEKGSTISDYVDVRGSKGGFQSFLQVYGRSGKPCPRCRAVLARSRVAGRTTSYCPNCQRVELPARIGQRR